MCIELEHPHPSVIGGFLHDGTLVTSCTEWSREPGAESLTFQWDAGTFDQLCDAIEGRLIPAATPDTSRFICSQAQNCLSLHESGAEIPVYEARLRTAPTRVNWHSSGKLFVACGSAIRIVHINTDRVVDLFKAKPNCRILPSPNGRRLAIAAGLTVQIIDTTSGEPVCAPLKHKRPVTSGFWINNRSIVHSSEDCVFRKWDVTSERPGRPLFNVPGFVTCLEVAKNSPCVLVGTQNQKKLSPFGGEIRLYDYKRGVAVTEPLTHSHAVIATCLHPSERYAAFGSVDKTAAIWDLSDSTKIAEFEAPGSVYGVQFSPNGEYLFAHGHRFSFIYKFAA